MNTNKVNGEISHLNLFMIQRIKDTQLNKHLGGFECEISNRDLDVDKKYLPNQLH